MKEIEDIYKDLLRLFKDYVIPGKEEGFVAKLREVLAIHQNILVMIVREKRPHYRSIISVRNLEYKAKERRLILEQKR